MKYLYKLMGNAMLFLLLINVGLPVFYFGTYKLINNVDTTIYARYATNGKYEENIFFNEEVEKETGFISEVEKTIKGVSEITRIQEFGQIVSRNSKEVEKLIDNNYEYQKYLTEKGSSTEDLIQWSKKIATLDDNIGIMCMYLLCLIYAFITVVGFKFRKTFYIFAGIVYTLVMTSVFSDGLSDYLIAYFISFISKLSSDIFTYQDMENLSTYFIQAYKESMLTFIIFDTIIQIYEANKETRRKESIRYIIYTLDYQINYLKEYSTCSTKYRARLKVSAREVISTCNKKSKRLDKLLRKDKYSIQYIEGIRREKINMIG